MRLQSYAQGQWVTGTGKPVELFHAVTGQKIGESNSDGVDFKGMLEYGRNVGGPKLRAMTFHQRARMLKAMAQHLMAQKDDLYQVSAATGATKTDSWIDIEGGIGTFFGYASQGRRQFPDETFYIEGSVERISKGGTFLGRHVCVPLEGVAVHINAFNFPCWGMLEKLAPTFLAGMPAIIKPATVTSFLTERMARSMLSAGILPEGALQIICGGVGDLLDHLTCQDVVTFTGSAGTGRKLKSHPRVISESVRFNLEADSLNYCILGPDAAPGSEEFDLFVKEVAKEMTVKAGQKCTAIRRTIVPEGMTEAVVAALSKRLAGAKLGDPAVDGVRMGPLAGRAQVGEVRGSADQIAAVCERVYGNPDRFEVMGADAGKGAFFPSLLYYCDAPFRKAEPHDVEAFGPVNTVMPYRTLDEAIALAKLGRGSLCGSVVTADDAVAREIVLGTAAYHGRLMVLNRHNAQESTGHGSPLPSLIHGGPGRAGGGEEMGGTRGVLHYMQRTALQGTPATLTAVGREWVKGAPELSDGIHPFRKHFDELRIGETWLTHGRTVTEADVVNFAGISGDYFYAHMDDAAAKASIFERRVAHGYFIVSAAAGL
ncbi:MAG TPA: phenylacetic acid degradation bifunctional protein PaaZ, partial [Gemmatimonadales bacterium]|nr:phenylacetic acid degradation bifunctional protein PaaZ [Gemmatimonadales bacterium]